MKLAYVEVAGFRGFKDSTRFDFPAGFVVLTGRNGVGKSTILDAIDFALTGTINKYAVKGAKGGGLESHIWWVGDGAAEMHYPWVLQEQMVRNSASPEAASAVWTRPSRWSVANCAQETPPRTPGPRR